jgi:hypothetical protein
VNRVVDVNDPILELIADDRVPIRREAANRIIRAYPSPPPGYPRQRGDVSASFCTAIARARIRAVSDAKTLVNRVSEGRVAPQVHASCGVCCDRREGQRKTRAEHGSSSSF